MKVGPFILPPIIVSLMVNKGANQIAYFHADTFNYWTGKWEKTVFPHLVHFFNPDGTEVGYWTDINPRNPQLFDPYRKWDDRIKEGYTFVSIPKAQP